MTRSSWNLNINGFILKKGNNELKSSKGCNARFEISDNFIVLPYEDLNNTLNLSEINCSLDEINEKYRLKCLASNGKLPELRLKINDTILTISSIYI